MPCHATQREGRRGSRSRARRAAREGTAGGAWCQRVRRARYTHLFCTCPCHRPTQGIAAGRGPFGVLVAGCPARFYPPFQRDPSTLAAWRSPTARPTRRSRCCSPARRRDRATVTGTVLHPARQSPEANQAAGSTTRLARKHRTCRPGAMPHTARHRSLPPCTPEYTLTIVGASPHRTAAAAAAAAPLMARGAAAVARRRPEAEAAVCHRPRRRVVAAAAGQNTSSASSKCRRRREGQR